MRNSACLLSSSLALIWLSAFFNQPIQAQGDIRIPDGFRLETPTADSGKMVLVHTASQVRLVRVPGGQYTIGTNEYVDSMRIQVSLQPFWFGESPLTYVQVAWMMEAIFASTQGDEPIDRVFRYGTLPRLDGMDAVYDDYYKLFDLYRTNQSEFETVACKKLEVFESEYLKALRTTGEADFDLADFQLATDFAELLGCKLPTEAQWEVATPPKVTDKPSDSDRTKMLYEWCSDFYSFESFRKMAESRDPKGPAFGSLTSEPLERATETSALPLRTAWMSRRLHVLRSVSDPERRFGLPVSRLTGNSMDAKTGDMPRRGVRLVLSSIDDTDLKQPDK